MIDYSYEINVTRNNYKSMGRSRKDKLKRIPSWVSGDALSWIYKDAPTLFAEGKIVYASLVQANNLMFLPQSRYNCPGNILFSMESYYDKNPKELRDIATMLFGYKGCSTVPPEITKVVSSITSENDRLFNIMLPLSVTQDHLVYFTTIMFHRNHLPDKYLRNSIFPVLALPSKLNSAIVLPGHYWSEALKKGV